eukprot:scaffold176436_cov32-Prasinocladus_malaysianus.AAC.1
MEIPTSQYKELLGIPQAYLRRYGTLPVRRYASRYVAGQACSRLQIGKFGYKEYEYEYGDMGSGEVWHLAKPSQGVLWGVGRWAPCESFTRTRIATGTRTSVIVVGYWYRTVPLPHLSSPATRRLPYEYQGKPVRTRRISYRLSRTNA